MLLQKSADLTASYKKSSLPLLTKCLILTLKDQVNFLQTLIKEAL